MAETPGENAKFHVDTHSLFQEEVFTDLHMATVRRLTPVKPDGSPDRSRKIVFVGQTSLMTPNGMIPLQTVIQAKELQQAFKRFPEAMQAALAQLLEEAEKIEREETSRIIVPGR